jgi:hypothetical protein
MVEHPLAELVALAADEERCLERTVALMVGEELIERHAALVDNDIVEPPAEEDVAVHVHTTLLPHGIEADSIGGISPPVAPQSLIDERTADGAGSIGVPQANLIVGQKVPPRVQTGLDFHRIRVVAEPA